MPRDCLDFSQHNFYNRKNMDNVFKLIWCSPHPNHYNSYLFKQISKSVTDNLEIVYFSKKLSKYPWKTDFNKGLNVRYLRKCPLLNIVFVAKTLFSKKSIIVVAGWNNFTMIILLTLMVLTRGKYILYTDTPDTRKRVGLKQKIRLVWLNFIFRHVYMVFVTGRLGVKLMGEMGVAPSKIVNFPFATDINYFTAKNISKDNEGIMFISSGRLDLKHKGYDTAIEALSILRSNHPGIIFKYKIAGTGPDREILEKMIFEKKLNHHVELLGWIEPSNLDVFYNSGSVLLHPSNFDPFPNAVLEAMACGLPIIGSNCAGSVLERVEEGINGYIFTSGNAKSLYEKIMEYVNKSTLERIEISQNARKTAEQWPVDYNIDLIRYFANA